MPHQNDEQEQQAIYKLAQNIHDIVKLENILHTYKTRQKNKKNKTIIKLILTSTTDKFKVSTQEEGRILKRTL